MSKTKKNWWFDGKFGQNCVNIFVLEKDKLSNFREKNMMIGSTIYLKKNTNKKVELKFIYLFCFCNKFKNLWIAIFLMSRSFNLTTGCKSTSIKTLKSRMNIFSFQLIVCLHKIEYLENIFFSIKIFLINQ